MFPIALAGAGAEWKNGLAWVIIGGLISSFLTFIIPVIYEIMEKLISKVYKGDKVDYEAEMVADYEHKALSEDGFNQSITLCNKLNRKKAAYQTKDRQLYLKKQVSLTS
jgi:HAE1 family hydrophobic/amphiphilic exporter-1